MLLTTMYSYCWVWWNAQTEVDADEFFPPEILPFHAALVLSALTWLLGLSLSSVSVLMLIMPPIKIYIKSYNATRSHASDQSPGKAETAVKSDIKSFLWLLFYTRQYCDLKVWHFTLDSVMISKFAKSYFCIYGSRTEISSWFCWERSTVCLQTPGQPALLQSMRGPRNHISSLCWLPPFISAITHVPVRCLVLGIYWLLWGYLAFLPISLTFLCFAPLNHSTPCPPGPYSPWT